MSDNWIVQNLNSALSTWNEKLAEIWTLLTQSPESFKGGTIWSVITGINGALTAIGYGLLVLFFAESISLGLKIKDLMQLQSIFTAFSYIPYFLSFSEIFAIVVRDIVLGLIFMGLGSWQYIYKIKKSLDEENLNKLD